jgi:hypothetical protein
MAPEANAKKSAVLDNARVIVEHLLKLQHNPAQGARRFPTTAAGGYGARRLRLAGISADAEPSKVPGSALARAPGGARPAPELRCPL